MIKNFPKFRKWCFCLLATAAPGLADHPARERRHSTLRDAAPAARIIGPGRRGSTPGGGCSFSPSRPGGPSAISGAAWAPEAPAAVHARRRVQLLTDHARRAVGDLRRGLSPGTRCSRSRPAAGAAPHRSRPARVFLFCVYILLISL